MKKVIILVMALAITIGVSAQENALKYGIKAGLNLAQISKDGDVSASDMKAGFFTSAHLNYSFSELLGIQPELMFSMQGGQQDINYLGTSINTKVFLNYINIPVMLDIKPFTNFSIMVGPQIGFNVYKSTTINGTKSDTKPEVNVIDFAAVLGVQYAIANHFLINARYNFGFTHAGKNTDGGCNRVLQIGVGYQF